MFTYTTIPKTVHCPKWDINVTLTAKYFYYDDNQPHLGTFQKAICPIVENGKLPLHEQEKELKLLRCHEYQECPLLSDFPEKLDTHNVTRLD